MVAVVGIVNYKGKILLGKKRSDSSKKLAGRWHLPGERVESGETDKEALIRGIREEAGIEIKVGRYIDFSIVPTNYSIASWYECFAETDKVNYASDLEDIAWVEKEKVPDFCANEAVSRWPNKVRRYFGL